MYKTITNKDEYIPKCNVEKLPIDYKNTKVASLFGKNITVYDNHWLWHLHLKCTDICNANCAFCVEKSCRNNYQDSFRHLINKKQEESSYEKIYSSFGINISRGKILCGYCAVTLSISV